LPLLSPALNLPPIKSANFSKQEVSQQVIFSNRLSFTSGNLMQCTRTHHSVSKNV